MNTLARLIGVLAVLVLAGCGGGMQAGVGSGGSGAPMDVGFGSVTGFGSVIVNGVRYDETQAEVRVDERPDAPTPASVAAIRLGVMVELRHRNGLIDTATAGAELIGPVASVSANGFVALGQVVRVNANPSRPTVFEGFASLGDLASGAVVEVHGERDGSGEILATRVELRPTGLALARLAGTAHAVNGRTFSIGALAVDATTAAVVPAGAMLVTGQRVVVWTDAPYTGGTFTAKVVRVGDSAIANNAAVTIDGVVARFQSISDFRVGGRRVDASGATFAGGSIADLTNGRAVRIRGTFADDLLRAASVEILPGMQPETHLTGAITDFVDAASPFRIRGALTRVTPQTSYVNGTAANLGTSVQVKLVGLLVGGVVEATTVEFLPVALDAQHVVTGLIAGPVGAVAGDGSRTFRLEGLGPEVKTTAGTAYRNGAAGDVAVGRHVRTRGSLQNGQFVADEMQFLDNPSSPASIEIEGTAGSVGAASMVVNGQTVLLAPTTALTLDGVPTTSASLRNGSRVEVVASRSGSDITALSVNIESEAARRSSVRGLVTRTPADATEFLVGGQRVSVAGQPQVVPGNRTLADVITGADVEAEGTIAEGVLHATRIKLR